MYRKHTTRLLSRIVVAFLTLISIWAVLQHLSLSRDDTPTTYNERLQAVSVQELEKATQLSQTYVETAKTAVEPVETELSVSGVPKNKVIVMAKLAVENTSWVAENLPE